MPGAHKVCLCPPRVFPQSCGSFVTKSHWPPKSNSLWVLSPFAGSPGWEICCGPSNFATVRDLLWYNCSPVCGLSARWLYVGFTPCASQVFCSQSPCPHSRPLLTHASTGDTQTLKDMSGSVSCGVPGAHKIFFEPSECLWEVWV